MRRCTTMMKAQLGALCVLLCLQSRGAAAAGEAQSESSVPVVPVLSYPSVNPGPSGPRSRRSPLDPPCALRSVLVQVRDLGLGYDSDETLLFKYCSGACPQLRSNHDLALSAALSGSRHYAPCCRPTHHEDMAFLDNKHRWHKVEALSAAGCHCVG
uniref:TGF-beta family profile domain-containing protein n=1 Tax=Periophthalmus magnuspinnatus TaxID=409849 RepID=A0A3B4AXA1_9GOBI